MLDLTKIYRWEIEIFGGEVITKGNDFDHDKVMRISYISNNILYPRHDIHFCKDVRFKKRFARGFLVMNNNTKPMKDYLHCVVTNCFRFYLRSSNGQSFIVDKNYEMYL